MRRSTPLSALLAAAAVALAACGGSSGGSPTVTGSSAAASSASGSSAASGPVVSTKVGVTVTGAKGAEPTLGIPSSAAPTTTSAEVLDPGDGDTVRKGDVLVVNYLGQTWAPKDGKPNVFDTSFGGEPTGFAIGVGAVVKGWDSTLVGQKLGSRVLLAIPPADGYGATVTADQPLSGQTLVFVVELLKAVKGDQIATGTAVEPAAGFPAVTSESGKRPVVTSVAGVKAGTTPTSSLLIKGTGEPIDATKKVVLAFLQTDVATGKNTQRTWDASRPEVIPAQNLLSLVSALKGQPVGSRAVAVTAQDASSPAVVLVVDVIGQF